MDDAIVIAACGVLARHPPFCSHAADSGSCSLTGRPSKAVSASGPGVSDCSYESADRAHKVIGMRQVRHMPRALECVALRMWQGFPKCVEDRSEERRALVAAREQHRSVECGEPSDVQ